MAQDPGEGVRHLREALGLWRGRPLADLAGLVKLEEEAEHLEVLHVQLQRAACEAGLALAAWQVTHGTRGRTMRETPDSPAVATVYADALKLKDSAKSLALLEATRKVRAGL